MCAKLDEDPKKQITDLLIKRDYFKSEIRRIERLLKELSQEYGFVISLNS